jgi:hypothetical protein
LWYGLRPARKFRAPRRQRSVAAVSGFQHHNERHGRDRERSHDPEPGGAELAVQHSRGEGQLVISDVPSASQSHKCNPDGAVPLTSKMPPQSPATTVRPPVFALGLEPESPAVQVAGTVAAVELADDGGSRDSVISSSAPTCHAYPRPRSAKLRCASIGRLRQDQTVFSTLPTMRRLHVPLAPAGADKCPHAFLSALGGADRTRLGCRQAESRPEQNVPVRFFLKPTRPGWRGGV